jgi:hypothetical protein
MAINLDLNSALFIMSIKTSKGWIESSVIYPFK